MTSLKSTTLLVGPQAEHLLEAFQGQWRPLSPPLVSPHCLYISFLWPGRKRRYICILISHFSIFLIIIFLVSTCFHSVSLVAVPPPHSGSSQSPCHHLFEGAHSPSPWCLRLYFLSQQVWNSRGMETRATVLHGSLPHLLETFLGMGRYSLQGSGLREWDGCEDRGGSQFVGEMCVCANTMEKCHLTSQMGLWEGR